MTIALVGNIIFTLAISRRGLVERLLLENYGVVIVAPEDGNANAFDGLDVRFRPVKKLRRSGLNPIADWQYLRELRTIFLEEHVTVALLFNIKPVIYGSLACRGTSTQPLSTITGAGNVFLKPEPLRSVLVQLYRLALLNNKIVLTQNQDDRSEMLRAGVLREHRTQTINGAGVNLESFPPRPLPAEPHFVFIGRLLKDKGITEFMAAAGMLSSSVDYPVRFTVVGGFDDQNVEVIGRDLFSRWKREGNVAFVGHQRDVRPYLAAATCVVLPSYREGMPRALLEGAATGRPLLATDVPGCREVVRDGENGYLVEARNSEALFAGMQLILSKSPEALLAMGNTSRKLVVEHFDEREINRRYLAIIANLLP
ncbi:glycosyltransferase family 4 protein [Neolewinella antarctica]|uniref:Glycosyltransferase involved in cell wall biosynthesis n=1 Tax=Neolewinella antarctica TaxID=442734 RepID=A0ABX0XAP6_9BACT|nr:glycosyltransferase family 4 protein [Neolewinella antarctica]NJC26135.1 glycosyltransferase involved in cell wall biosynthesis [Neolewinella antarctica]